MASESIVNRMVRAARLDKAFYNEVEANTSLTNEALLVVIIGALASGAGGLISGIFGGFGAAITTMIVNILMVVVGYFIWVFVTQFVGTRFFGGTADVGEMRRTLGYAMAPQVLNILGFIPCVGGIIGLVVWVWTLAAGFIAVREAMDFDNGKAIITVVIGWLIIVIVGAILGAIFGIGAFAVSSLTN
jgi:hypothetical protein